MHELSATELLTQYRRGSLSPVEVVQATIAHVERWEPQIHAFYRFEPEAALAAARESERRWRRGEALALDGVPLTLKENIATAGCPMPLGTAALADAIPATADAPPAARLREAGAILLGKTTMPDYGMLSSGVSSLHATTRNPWDVRLNPGGSSAGAAAAAAAGYGPLHVGTDIGGSLRLPASWCGIFTLKPSLGRIPIQPPYAGRVAGPMTRSVADAALMMGPLSRPDWRDGMSLPAQDIAWRSPALAPGGLRIGLWLDAGWGLAVDPEVRAAVEAAARLLEQAGARVEPLTPFSTRAMIDGLDRFWRMRSWLDISALAPERRARVLPYIRDWVAAGEHCTAAELFQGFSQMAAFRDAAIAACQPFDFVLSPVAPVPAFAAGLASPLDDPARPFEHIAFTVPFNFSEQPAASIPCGHTAAGLPIGLQVVGKRHDDLGVLRLCAAFEVMLGAQMPWPQP